MKLEIHHHTHSQIKIIADRAAEQELREAFTFMAPNYKFNPKYKAGLWNGKISMFNAATKKMPAGLKENVIKYCEDTGIEYECIGFEEQKDLITREELEKFIKGLKISSRGTEIEVRDYQFECILKSINARRLISKVPTSGGKSLIIYVIVRWFLENDLRFMLVVPNIMLVGQMYSDFEDYASLTDFSVPENCHKLHGGEAKEFSKNVLISTWQSLSAIVRSTNRATLAKLLNTYDGVCIDECHGAKSKELSELLESVTEIGFRFGTTGTIDPTPAVKLTIEGHIGPIYTAITTKELIDRSQVSNIQIKALVMKYPDPDRKLVKDYDYQTEIDFICAHDKRNRFIKNVALATSGTTLILVQNVEKHAVPLYQMISKQSTRPVYYIAGSVKATVREEIRIKANTEDCIIVATYQTLSTGVSIPNIRNVIFGSPSKSMTRVLQSIGRGLRLHKGKSQMTLIDLIDDIKYRKKANYALQHFEERLRIYQTEQFPITITEVPL